MGYGDVRLAVLCGLILGWHGLAYVIVGVYGAFGRNWRLTSGQFWRILGIGLLTVLIGGVAGSILTAPIAIIGQFGPLLAPEYAVLILVLTQAVGLIVEKNGMLQVNDLLQNSFMSRRTFERKFFQKKTNYQDIII